jgi:hypothetical protein
MYGTTAVHAGEAREPALDEDKDSISLRSTLPSVDGVLDTLVSSLLRLAFARAFCRMAKVSSRNIRSKGFR